MEKGSHWVDDKTLGGRAYFQAAADPATLTIESMKSVDSGIYRCRVDFLKSPTRNSRVQLKVISKLNLFVCFLRFTISDLELILSLDRVWTCFAVSL